MKRTFKRSDAGRDVQKSDSFFVKPKRKEFTKSTTKTNDQSSNGFSVKSRTKLPKNDPSDTAPPKRVFDKKKWQQQRYSKKFKVQQWEERRKKAMLRQYYKETKHDQNMVGKYVRNPDFVNDQGADETERIRPSSYKTALQEYEKIQNEKKEKRERYLQAQKEREEKIKEYKKKKAEKMKKLGRKTKKGQPVMQGRIELLLEKIAASLT